MRLTLKATLLGLFAVMAAVMVGQGAYSIVSLSNIDSSVKDISENYLPSVLAVAEINKSLSELRIKQYRLVMRDPSEPVTQEDLKALEDAGARLKTAVETYAPLVSDGEERTLSAKLGASITKQSDYFQEKVRPFIKTQSDQARAAFLGDQAALYNEASAFAQQDADFNSRNGLASAAEAAGVIAFAQSAGYTALVIAAIVALAGVVVCLVRIVKPLSGVTQFMGLLAGGDLQSEVPYHGRNDEIGAMSSAIQVFKDGMIRNKALEAETAKTREQAEAQRKTMMMNLADQFEQAVGGIVTMVSSAATEMQATSQQLSGSAQQTSAQSNVVASAAEEAGTNVSSVAAAAEQLSASVGEIGRQVEMSAERAKNAVSEANATKTIVTELSDGASRIDGIVEMISEIANQTNLLALNATIEAARAGEHGRGFAIVAAEVKNLAGQTAKATGEIGAQITAIKSATTQTVSAIEGISDTIRNINETSSAIASAVEEQGAATREIVQAIAQASAGAGEVSSNIVSVARAAEETGLGAAQVNEASSELARQAETLRSEVNKFLATVRAA